MSRRDAKPLLQLVRPCSGTWRQVPYPPVADACDAPVLRDQGPERPARHGKADANLDQLTSCSQNQIRQDCYLALCGCCYQAGAQVLWNALAGRLWSRTTIYLYRALAQLVGVPEAELRALIRISFAKVAEYQKRGAVHFHAIIRLDAATDCACSSCVAPPPAGFTAELLERAVRRAATIVSVSCPPVTEDQGVTLTARWGEQLDVLSAEQVAGWSPARWLGDADGPHSAADPQWPADLPGALPRPGRAGAFPSVREEG